MGDLGLIPGLGRSPGEGKGYPLQYSGLENSMDCIVQSVSSVAQSRPTIVTPSTIRSMEFPGQNTGEGSLSLLQRIFPTQGLNPGWPRCRRILDQLSHQGGPRILEWIAYPFSGDLPDPGIEPGSPVLQADSLPTELWEKHAIELFI